MSTYTVYTKIESNVPADNLLYDLAIYRMDPSKRKHYILSGISKQPVQSNYETLRHQTSDTTDPITTIYIVELMLYRKHFLNTYPALDKPFIRMYTLEEIISGKACSENKRENTCYFESTGESKPINEGDNTITLSITIPERPFIAKEYPIGHPKDPFTKKRFEEQIFFRTKYMDYPNQVETSLCGPAAFFYCLLRDRPDIYEQTARSLWQYGQVTVGNLTISPSKACLHPSGTFYTEDGKPRISGLDWITLASLRDSGNSMMSYSEVDDRAAGVTLEGILTEWFIKAGYQKVFSNISLAHSNIQDIVTLNRYISQGYTVVSLISAGMLERADGDTSWKNHWIVWEDTLSDMSGKPITLDSHPSDPVKLTLFSWGDVNNQIRENLSLEHFLTKTFGALVLKKII